MYEDSENAGVTSVEETLVPGPERPYRRLHVGPGEPQTPRYDLMQDGADSREPQRKSAGLESETDISQWNAESHVAGLIHFTDFQIADLASPSRVEYLQRLAGEPEWERMLPAYRPQEFLLAQAIEVTVRSVNAFAASSPERWNLALTTGDNTDSAQSNELTAFLTYMEGGRVEPAAGTRDFADAPVGLGDEHYYNPETASHDVWKIHHGLPTHPGALAAAARPFDGEGLGLPWLSCFGNHDCLVQGRAAAPSDYDTFLTGASKPVAISVDAAPPGDKLSAYVSDPIWAGEGTKHQIDADSERRMVTKSEYVKRHLAAPGMPVGHGFTEDNSNGGTAYFVYDGLPNLRIIVLDTTNLAGHVDGCVDAQQFEWLEQRLIEVHSHFVSDNGSTVRGGGDDRVVVISSHHGLSTMTNNYGEFLAEESGQGRTLHLAADVEALLHRFGNVALWLSGHTHINRITPRPGSLGGFWEISTGSIAEWPVQFRGIEILAEEKNLHLRTTMVDLQAPAAPDGSLDLRDLASLHREIGANDAGSVGGLNAEGARCDRNQDLIVPVSSELLAALSAMNRNE
ncbi:metallophosphoesterase [Brevibacterium sp. FME37]|uniref:metallophosphoesterase n=1 Tax=Brevibacterium sp. FME37 TaxID=2742607 RepID=UPI0018686482|nr:metallophosphoesterase [Brevibacterium sp. FME37]